MRRGEQVIFLEVLHSISLHPEGAHRTAIMYDCRTNITRVRVYLKRMIEKGWVRPQRQGYRQAYFLTDLGRKVLKAARTLLALVK